MSLAGQFVNLLAALLLLIAFAMLTQRRILTLIHLYAWQGAALAAKLALAGAGLSFLENALAKLRLFLAPEFLSTAFLLAVLGMLTHFLSHG